MKIIETILVFISISFLFNCQHHPVIIEESPYPISNDNFTMDTIAEGFTIPYGIAIVEENEYYVTDRIGKLFHIKEGIQTEIIGIPEVLTFKVKIEPLIIHGGLMDISIHPNYSINQWIYISYLDKDGLAKVARFKLQNYTVREFEDIFSTRNTNITGNGMRIVWQDDKHFFLNIGTSNLSNKPQNLQYDIGKIHRLTDDGSIPSDNPIFNGFKSPSTIWSYGHRDVQGLYYDKTHQVLLGLEHGPKGGDELNIIKKGKNYGWPIFTYGINYNGDKISTITEDSASKFTVLPEQYWTVPTSDGGQAIAPSCLLKVHESNIPDWNGHLLFSSLVFRKLMKYKPETETTFSLNITGRIRTIKQLPSGNIIALIERNNVYKTNGLIVRISS
jgi:glucose/arabinose dehydrogenase